MKKLIAGVAALFFLSGAAGAEAQSPFELELKPGSAFPTQDIQNESLGTGFGSEVTIAYWFIPELAVYGGWDWYRFTPDRSFAGADTDIEETGYAYGLRFEYPFISNRESSPAIRVHAGGTYNHLEFENADGDRVADSDHGVGWEAGAGVAFPVGDAWKITPGARFRSLSRYVTLADVTTDVDLQYIAAEVAVSWSFGS